MISYLLDKKLLVLFSGILVILLLVAPSDYQAFEEGVYNAQVPGEITGISGSADATDGDSRNQLQKGLMAYYRFDRKPSESYSIEFDGVDDYISLGNDYQELGVDDPFTVSVWVRPEETGYLVTRRYSGYGSEDGWLLGYNNDRIEVGVGNSDQTQVDINTSEWVHAVLVNYGDEHALFINGTEKARASSGSNNTDVDVLVGARRGSSGNTGSGWNYHGLVDDLQIYTRALSDSEIKDLYNEKSIDDENLVSYLGFDEGPENCDLTAGETCLKDKSEEGNYGAPQNFNDSLWNSGSGWSTASPGSPLSVRDYSTNNYNATLEGGRHGRLSDFAFNSSSGWTGGIRGKSALRFEEGSRVADINNTELVEAYNDDRKITINLWFRVDELNTATSYNDLIQFGDNLEDDGSTSTNGVRLERNGDSNQSLAFYTRHEGGNSQYQIGSVDPYEIGTWHMATLVMDYSDEGESRAYLDGELSATRSDPGDSWDMTPGTMEIFAQGGWADFSMDDLRFYSRDLSDSEVEALYRGERVRESLVGEWRFDRGEGSTAYETSSIQREGVLNTDTVSFDGVDDYVEIRDFPSVESSITVSAWVKSTAGDTYTSGWSAVSRYSQFILGPESGEMSFIVRTPSDGWTYLDAPETPNKDRWHHFAGTWNSSSGMIRLWMDGKLVKERQYAAENPESDAGPVDIGHRETNSQGERHLQAKIDDVRIYNRTLGREEVQRLAFQ